MLWRMKLSGSNIFCKNALAGLRKIVFLNPTAPRSVFLWRLGCNASRKIRLRRDCEADLAKLIAPKFFRPALPAFAANYFCHCHQPKSSIMPNSPSYSSAIRSILLLQVEGNRICWEAVTCLTEQGISDRRRKMICRTDRLKIRQLAYLPAPLSWTAEIHQLRPPAVCRDGRSAGAPGGSIFLPSVAAAYVLCRSMTGWCSK